MSQKKYIRLNTWAVTELAVMVKTDNNTKAMGNKWVKYEIEYNAFSGSGNL